VSEAEKGKKYPFAGDEARRVLRETTNGNARERDNVGHSKKTDKWGVKRISLPGHRGNGVGGSV